MNGTDNNIIRLPFKDYILYTVSDRRTIILLVIGLVGLALYACHSIFFSVDDYHTFSPYPTIFLQELLGTSNPFAFFCSVYYTFLFAINLALVIVSAYVVPYFGKKKVAPWAYIVGIFLVWFVDMILYVIYPVAPPIRYNSGACRIRQKYLPWSEVLIRVKYNALPSGHIMYLTCGFYIARYEKVKKLEMWYLINIILTSFIVIYLGEHYIIDIVSGFIITIIIMDMFIRYANKIGFSRMELPNVEKEEEIVMRSAPPSTHDQGLIRENIPV